MSLAKAVSLIADIIEEDAKKLDLRFVEFGVRELFASYVHQIRIAVMAAEDAKTHLDITLPRQQDERLKKLAEKEERHNSSMAQIVGGNSDGDFVQIDPTMPVGAKTLVAGQVVQLRDDGKLHYLSEETNKMIEAARSKSVDGSLRGVARQGELQDELRPLVDQNSGIVIP